MDDIKAYFANTEKRYTLKTTLKIVTLVKATHIYTRQGYTQKYIGVTNIPSQSIFATVSIINTIRLFQQET